MSNKNPPRSDNLLTPEELKRELENDEIESKKDPELWRKNNEWLEKFQCHVFWQTTLMKLKVWTNNDYRSS